MPLMPYISPAAIGCNVVRFAGAPVSAYRCPISCNTASGQPSPEDEETLMTSESPINRAASAPVSTGTVRIDPPEVAVFRAAVGDGDSRMSPAARAWWETPRVRSARSTWQHARAPAGRLDDRSLGPEQTR